MPANGVPTSSVPEPPRKRGCLFWGCLSVVCVLVLCAVLVGVAMMRLKTFAETITTTEPEPVPAYEATAEDTETAQTKLQALQAAVKDATAGTFRFNGSDLNTLVATLPDCQQLRGRAYFEIDGDELAAQASFPLDDVPGMAGRYLNGRIALDVNCENGILEVYARDIQVKGQPIPEKLMADLSKINLAQKVYENPAALEMLKQIEQIEIKDGTVTIQTRERRQ